jgi:glycosyltransferase involved in cell wall biosynthesis
VTPTVVHVTADTGLFGGKDRVLLWLLTKLRDRNLAQPVVVCFRNGLVAGMYRGHGLHVETLPMSFQFDARAAFRLARLLRSHGAHLVHTHDHKSHVLGRLAGRLTGVKVVSTLHGLISDSKEMSAPKRALYGAIVHGTDHLTDWWIAVSRALWAGLRHTGRATYVPNGVDMELAAEGEDRSLPREAGPVVLCLGRLSREKGQDVLLDAMARVARAVPGVVVWMAGEGPTGPKLRSQSARLGIADRVRFLGFREHIAPLLRETAVLALPSRGEGLPISALEAMSLGVPVVATAVGGVPDLLPCEDVGRLVPPEDPDALAAALVPLLCDPTLAQRIGASGRAHVGANFSSDRMAEGTAAVYRAVLGL